MSSPPSGGSGYIILHLLEESMNKATAIISYAAFAISVVALILVLMK